MSGQNRVTANKFLNLVSRYKPEEVDLKLEPEGWIHVDKLLAAFAK